MSALSAVVYREAKIRATNFTFIFWIFSFRFFTCWSSVWASIPRSALRRARQCELQRVFSRGNSGHASSPSLPILLVVFPGPRQRHLLRNAHLSMSRSEYLLGKVIFNVFIAVVQAALTLAVAPAPRIRVHWPKLPLLLPACRRHRVGFSFTRFSLSRRSATMSSIALQRLLLHLHVCQLDVLSARALPYGSAGPLLNHHLGDRLVAAHFHRVGNFRSILLEAGRSLLCAACFIYAVHCLQQQE